MAKQPCSGWLAEGETRLSQRHDKAVVDGEQVLGPYDEEFCRVVIVHPAGAGASGSRARLERAKAMEGVKTLAVQYPGTRRRRGSGTITQPITEQERSVSVPAGTAAGGQPAVPGKAELYKRRGVVK